jgi:hypothetical protein
MLIGSWRSSPGNPLTAVRRMTAESSPHVFSMTRRALDLLDSPRNDAYEAALAALRDDTQAWWADTLARDPDEFDRDFQSDDLETPQGWLQGLAIWPRTRVAGSLATQCTCDGHSYGPRTHATPARCHSCRRCGRLQPPHGKR